MYGIKALEKMPVGENVSQFQEQICSTSLWGSGPLSCLLLNQMWQKKSIQPGLLWLESQPPEWQWLVFLGLLYSSDCWVRPDWTHGSPWLCCAHTCLFTAWARLTYSILVICVLKLHTYLHRCKISAKQNKASPRNLCVLRSPTED